ncbi:retrovirus-related pol polyprotein from transposon TNT 1-94 [Tanacetum coccineum]|uniref:Retrovirus-related pol polyprotein from transposon TNT 1-94 n=1 Tax=Tanacetum coccineum TaxID=301880 RepID=A0ABQ5GEJ8_9ASTR
MQVVQVILWYLDSGCSKHMTGNRSKLKNFVEKFIGSVRFGNDHFGAIMGYGDYVIGDSVISRVYYVEGLGHNLFSVGQFCDSDLEVAFRKHTCFVRDINGTNILKGSRGTNLYTISIDEMMKSSPICLLSKASKSKSWLWHRRLNHLNFGTINDLARKDLVRGLPRLKFEKDHLCSACQLGKSKKFSHKPKSENTNMEVLHTLHMDLCGPMRVQSINGKKYILVIVDDYSRFTWVKFLRSKDETPEFVINFLKQIQVGLNKTVRYIRTDNGTEFVNQVMSKYYEGVGIFHQKSVPRTPQQNGVVERRNRTLVEAARTMLIFSKAPMFLWAEAVATACYTQNRSLIHTRHNKTPYELVHDKKPDLTFLRVFGALCYPTNDSEDLGKFQAKADIGIFVGYAPSRKGYRIYNKRTRRLMETIHVTFDEMHQTMAPVRISSGPEPIMMTPGQLNSGLAPSPVPATTYIPPTDKDLEILFQPMFDEYFEQSTDSEPVPMATVVNAPIVSTNTSVSTTIAQDAPSTSHSLSSSQVHPPVFPQGVAAGPTIEDTSITQADLHPSVNPVAGEPSSAQSTSGDVSLQPSITNIKSALFEAHLRWEMELDDTSPVDFNLEAKVASLNNSKNYKAHPYQNASRSKQILKSKEKPYPPCTHCGFNNHHPDDCRNYPEYEIYGSYDHFTSGHNRVIHVIGGVLAESSQSSKSSIRVSCTTCGSNVHSTIDHNDFDHFKRGEKIQATKAKEPTKNGFSRSMAGVKSYMHKYVEKPGPKFDDKQGTIFNANKEIVLIAPRRNDVYVLGMSSLTPNRACFFAKASKSMVENQNDVKVKQIRIDNRTEFRNSELKSFCDGKEISQNFSSLYTPEQNSVAERKNRTLIEAARTMLNGLVLSEHFWTDAIRIACPPSLINTEGTQVQEVQTKQINHQPTKETSRNNTETSIPIIEPLVPEVPQSQSIHHASTSSYPVTQDRWSRDQHTELVNIISDPREGMLLRNMAIKLIDASASEYLFVDFLSKIEPNKVSEALKHPGWVDAMQEELNQFYENKV